MELKKQRNISTLYAIEVEWYIYGMKLSIAHREFLLDLFLAGGKLKRRDTIEQFKMLSKRFQVIYYIRWFCRFNRRTSKLVSLKGYSDWFSIL